MKRVDFKTSPYFSGIFIFLGIFLALIGLFILGIFVEVISLGLFFRSVIGVAILLLFSLIIFTTHYRLSIDFETKTFQDYVWFLGIKSGEMGKFERVEYLFVKKNTISQKMQLKAANSTVRKDVYDGYLKFSETQKIHLLTKDNKQDVIKKLSEISTMLNVRIIDYSSGEADEI